MSSLQAILEAASTLSNIKEVDKEGLLLHRDKLKVALDSLHSLLQTPCASVNGSSSTFRSSTRFQGLPREGNTPATPPPATPPSVTSSPATPMRTDSTNTETPKCVIELINLLHKRENEILESMRHDPKSVIQSATDWSTEDPRIVDISQIDHPERSTVDRNIRSGYAALSLADEYTEWEYQTKVKRKSRIEQLCDDLNSRGRSCFFKEFVDSHQFNNRNKANKYLRYGVRLRVFSRICSSCPAVHTEPLGIVAIVSSCFRAFMRINTRYLPLLARLLMSSNWKKHAIDKDEWAKTCFQTYNDRICTITQAQKRSTEAPECEERRKRQRRESCPSNCIPPNLRQTEFPILQQNLSFTPILDVDPLVYPHVIDPQNTSFAPILEVDPLVPPHVLDPQQDTSFAPPLNVDPLGQPHLYEPGSDNSSPFPLPSEQIVVAVQNVIAGIPHTNGHEPPRNSISCTA